MVTQQPKKTPTIGEVGGCVLIAHSLECTALIVLDSICQLKPALESWFCQFFLQSNLLTLNSLQDNGNTYLSFAYP